MDPIKEIAKRLKTVEHNLGDYPLVTLWQADVARGSTLTCYALGGRLFIVQEWTDVGGWDIYVPASTTNSVPDTIKAVVDYLTSP